MLDLAIRQTSSKLQEELKKKSTSDRKDYMKKNNPSPDIFVETPLTATLVEESITVNPNFLSPETHNQKKNSCLAIKLSRLKDKQVRFESHKEFVSRCITDVLVPKGLELMLEPAIGNHDQNFLHNCYSK